MEPRAQDDAKEQRPQPAQDDKLIISSVVSHDKLLGMIEERNPILARRQRRA